MMAKSFLISSIVLFFSITLQTGAFGAALRRLTPEAFLAKGTWVLLGEVFEVQVLGQDKYSEYGNVVIRVDEVLEGKVDAALVSFPYKRRLGPVIVNGYGWDLVARPEVGKKLIIYFTRQDGTYSVSTLGANSIQKISSFNDPKIGALRETIRLHRLPR